MNFSLIYLANRFFYRLFDFVRAWYLGSFQFIGRHTVDFLEGLDQVLAWQVTFRNLFQPLYQDHTILGHVLGFIFRTLRLIFGGVIYVFFISLAVTIYFVWILIPIFIIYRGFF